MYRVVAALVVLSSACYGAAFSHTTESAYPAEVVLVEAVPDVTPTFALASEEHIAETASPVLVELRPKFESRTVPREQLSFQQKRRPFLQVEETIPKESAGIVPIKIIKESPSAFQVMSVESQHTLETATAWSIAESAVMTTSAEAILVSPCATSSAQSIEVATTATKMTQLESPLYLTIQPIMRNPIFRTPKTVTQTTTLPPLTITETVTLTTRAAYVSPQTTVEVAHTAEAVSEGAIAVSSEPGLQRVMAFSVAGCTVNVETVTVTLLVQSATPTSPLGVAAAPTTPAIEILMSETGPQVAAQPVASVDP